MDSTFRRLLTCQVSVNIRGRHAFPAPPVLSVDYALELPALGFILRVSALVDEGVIVRAPDPEGALIQAGLGAFALHMNAKNPPATISASRPRPRDLDPDVPTPLNLSRKDQEVLRGLGISPD